MNLTHLYVALLDNFCLDNHTWLKNGRRYKKCPSQSTNAAPSVMSSSKMCDVHKMVNDSQSSKWFEWTDKQRQISISRKVNDGVQRLTVSVLIWLWRVEKKKPSILSLDARLTPEHPHPTLPSPPPFPNLPQKFPSFLPSLPSLPLSLSFSGPPGWRVARGQEPVSPLFSLSSPCLFSITAQYVFLSIPPSLSLPCKYFCRLIIWSTFPFLSPSLSLSPYFSFFPAPSLAQAVLRWHIDWGFYSPSLTSSLSVCLLLSVSLSLSISFVPQCTVMLKPLWSVFVSVYLLLS